MQPQGTIASRYKKLEGDRSAYVNRARACASVTIPSLFPLDDRTKGEDFQVPSQSLGAKLVNTLSAKLLLALLPPNNPFARLTVDDEDLGNDLDEETVGEVEEVLSKTEREVLRQTERNHLRPVLHETVKQLVVAGNGLLRVFDDSYKLYKLNSYVVKRDGSGKVREIILEEPLDSDSVPKHIQPSIEGFDQKTEKQKEEWKVYTQIKRNGSHWVVNQEMFGILDPKARSTFPLNKLPYVPLRMIRVDGEDYGRSYVEEYIGDIKTVDVLSQALREASVAAARIIYLVRQGSTTKPKVLREAPNGGFVAGREEDVSVLQLQKQADFAVARQHMVEIKEELSAAFLMNSSLTRNAERVTATEIRAMAQELEVVLGGVYSLLATEMQLPLVHVTLSQLQKAKRLPQLPDGVLKPQIMTGIAALGRTQELDKVRLLLEYLAPLGPETIAQNINVAEYIARVAANLQIDPEGLVPTKEERQSREQQMQMQQMMQQLGPEILKQSQGGNPSDVG